MEAPCLCVVLSARASFAIAALRASADFVTPDVFAVNASNFVAMIAQLNNQSFSIVGFRRPLLERPVSP
jgi:hypothetical protein